MHDADLDAHTGYSLGSRVGCRPNPVSGLEVGASMRLTRIRSDQLEMSSGGDMDVRGMDMSGMHQPSMAVNRASTGAGDDEGASLNVTIIVGYVVYLEYPVHLLAEVFSIDHTSAMAWACKSILKMPETGYGRYVKEKMFRGTVTIQ
jgi:hypothetical protein